jgi:lipopolysaccharide/colanic/teichoic acid biosynthesis glycosyltransferase
MRITYLGRAGLPVDRAGPRLLMDPWLAARVTSAAVRSPHSGGLMLSIRNSSNGTLGRRLSSRKTAVPGTRDEMPAAVLAAPASGIGPSPARRLLDVAVAIVVLGLVWPLFLMLVLATRRSTGGSAIYRQLRVGEGGVPFTLFKFRSMRAGKAGPEVTAPGDDRVTRLGALLRKTSIDELPQLVNVLLGDMTLVGPRPETVGLARRYPGQFEFIFRYRPGMTGPTQVLLRDDKVLGQVADVENFYLTELVPRRVAMDLGYLRNPTMTGTIRWLVATLLYLIHTVRPRPGRAARPP